MFNQLTEQEQALLETLKDRQASMLETITMLCDINSGSYNNDGIEKVQNKFEALFDEISDSYEEITLNPVSNILDNGQEKIFQPRPMQVFRARPEAPFQLLLTGHSDTVFPENSHFQACTLEGNELHGPGTADMKGGLVVMLEALKALDASPYKNDFGFTVAISSEEEIGSPSSGMVLMDLAQGKNVGLTYEPALTDGTLAGERKGSGNFTMVFKGKSTHAGREFFLGKNAVLAACHATMLLSDLTSEESGVTVNVARINGGGAVNVVPDHCILRFNIRIQTPEQQQLLLDQVQDVVKVIEEKTGCEVELHGSFNRPPKAMTEDQIKLFSLLKTCGENMGMEIRWKATGGCCEGNNLAAAGLVNIDTLGVRGAHIHSDKEFACVDSFVERAQLSALLIARLIQNQSDFKKNEGVK